MSRYFQRELCKESPRRQNDSLVILQHRTMRVTATASDKKDMGSPRRGRLKETVEMNFMDRPSMSQRLHQEHRLAIEVEIDTKLMR